MKDKRFANLLDPHTLATSGAKTAKGRLKKYTLYNIRRTLIFVTIGGVALSSFHFVRAL